MAWDSAAPRFSFVATKVAPVAWTAATAAQVLEKLVITSQSSL
jgi:hypothetical protein